MGSELSRGFIFGRKSAFNSPDIESKKFLADATQGITFYSEIASSGLSGQYFYKAFAENPEGINYGEEKQFTLPRITAGNSWQDGLRLDGSDEWWKSDWFGAFYTDLYPWVYHSNLGWVFVYENSAHGAWLYHERIGWIWTMPGVFPSLYINMREEWTYLNTERMNTTLYDYSRLEWFEPDKPIKVLGTISPLKGGSILGLGHYYRWDSVILEAKPNANFNFGGWSGDLNGVDERIVFEAVEDVNVEASFLLLPSAANNGKEVVEGALRALEKMESLTDSEKKKSIVELLILGKSQTSGLSIETSE